MITLGPHLDDKAGECPCGCGWKSVWPPVVWWLKEKQAWLNEHYLGSVEFAHGIAQETGRHVKVSSLRGEFEFAIFPTKVCVCHKAAKGEEDNRHLPRWLTPPILFPEGEWDDYLAFPDTYDEVYALAVKFQVKRREKKKCPWPFCKDTSHPAFHCETCNDLGYVWTPWTLDPEAMQALNVQYDPTHEGGWKLVDEKCGTCFGKRKLTLPSNDDGIMGAGTQDCHHCQGTGRDISIYMDLGGKRWREDAGESGESTT